MEVTLNQLRDGLSSLTYRMSEMELLLNKKVPQVQADRPSGVPGHRREEGEPGPAAPGSLGSRNQSQRGAEGGGS